jgi:hypothetical protein
MSQISPVMAEMSHRRGRVGEVGGAYNEGCANGQSVDEVLPQFLAKNKLL